MTPERGRVADSDVHLNALARATELLGGAAELAKKLEIPESMVEMWIAERFIPNDIFMRIVDIIIDRDIDAIKDAAARQRKEA